MWVADAFLSQVFGLWVCGEGGLSDFEAGIEEHWGPVVYRGAFELKGVLERVALH